MIMRVKYLSEGIATLLAHKLPLKLHTSTLNFRSFMYSCLKSKICQSILKLIYDTQCSVKVVTTTYE